MTAHARVEVLSALEEFPVEASMFAFGARPTVRGRSFDADGQEFWLRGATYGAFRPDVADPQDHDLALIDRDFASMAAAGFNTVRIPHTMPLRDALDIALRHGLRVMVSLPAEQYAGARGNQHASDEIDTLIREKVKACVGHPALFCYALGNEIPASLMRRLRPRKVERYLRRLYHVVKKEDPIGLVTHVNGPATDSLHLPFLDFLSFNVPSSSEPELRACLARLGHMAGGRPVVITALESASNGEGPAPDGQFGATFEAECAGSFAFAWKDDAMDREFGPPPQFAAVEPALAAAPLATEWQVWRARVVETWLHLLQLVARMRDGHP